MVMAERYPRPDWVRRIIAMGDSVGGAERLVPLDADALVAAAARSTGLDDFGDFDGDWRSRLDALVAAIEETGRLHALGRLMTRQEILRGLRTRLFLTRARKEAPASTGEPVRAPMVITGPPRSGTSILFELVSLDPAAHGPLAWEAIHPARPDADPETLRRLSECEQEFWADVQPEFAAIHELRSDLPVECVTLQLPSFAGGHWSMVADIPGWLPDPPAAMDYHQVLLQTLQHGRRPFTWVLKTPMYLTMIDLLFATYPDAWVLMTHRDPVKTVPSGLSTLAMVRWERSEHVEPEGLTGPDNALMLDLMTALGMRRDAGELPDRFVDLHFADLMADPVAAIGKAYQRMGRSFRDEHADAIRRYVAEKPRGKFGAHRYDPRDWGFDPAALRERARPYTDRFGVQLED
jgi:hypothetical protein